MVFDPAIVKFVVFGVVLLGEAVEHSDSDVFLDSRFQSTWIQTNITSARGSDGRQIAPKRKCRSWKMEKDETPDIPLKDDVWQPVQGSHKFFVYSAYCYRGEKCSSLKIIAATKRSYPNHVLCEVQYPNNITLVKEGSLQVIPEHHKLEYSAFFIKCSLGVDSHPDSVSIVTRQQLRPPTNRLRVVDTKKYKTSERISICVKPLHFSYDKIVQLVEFMELNAILGMEHVTFYNSSISNTTDCILRHYAAKGRATVLPWKDRFISQKEIRTENLLAAQNDCLYRNRHNFSYIAFLDMDEFIMPKRNYTIRQLLQEINGRNRSQLVGSYNFRNAFFYLQWPNDPVTNTSSDVYERAMASLLKTRRISSPLKHQRRSKFIVNPTGVVTVGNHQVWQFEKGYTPYKVDPEEGLLNHYRICEFGGNDCVHSQSLVDRTAFRYKKQLSAAVKHRWRELQGRCRLRGIRQAREREMLKWSE